MYRGLSVCKLGSFAIATAAWLAAGVSPSSAQPAYSLTILARTGTVHAGKMLTDVGPATIGNSGKVVFWGAYGDQAGIFGRYNLLVKSGDVIGGKTLILDSNFDIPGPIGINNCDTLVFAARFNGGGGIFTQSRALAKTGDVIEGRTLVDSFRGPVINASGTIAFFAAFNGPILGGSGPYGIFTQNKFLVRQGNTVQGQYVDLLVAPPALDNHGNVSVLFSVADDFSQGTALFLAPSGILARSTDMIGGVPVQQISNVSLSGVGRVVFSAGGKIFTRNSVLETDSIDGESILSAEQASVNDAGTVAFHAQTATGEGIFTQLHKVVTLGDLIGGKRPTHLDVPMINNQDQIVFRARFADGTVGIVLATPKGRAANVNPAAL